MARAVMRLFDGVQLAFGPTIDNGFYYDFELPHPLSEEDFPRIEAEMAEDRQGRRAVRAARRCRATRRWTSAANWARSSRSSTSRPAWPTRRTLSFYRQGEFIDLCRGPHIPSTGHIGGVQAALGRRRVLERRRLAAAAAAALRHRVLRQEGARRPSRTARRSQAPRPPRARQAAGTVHHQPAGRLRA